MNHSEENSIASTSASVDFEATLRLIATLSAPKGLEERVQAGLRAAPASNNGRVLAWPAAPESQGSRFASSLLRSAAAAAIFAVIIGGSWGVYSRVQTSQAARAIPAPPRVSTQGGFSSAGAMRTPQTLNGPMVEHPAVTQPATAVPLPAEPAGKPAVQDKQTTLDPARKAAANTTVSPTATSPGR